MARRTRNLRSKDRSGPSRGGRRHTRATDDPIARRLANERGNVFTPGPDRVALLYPSPYRAGMSSLGFQWVLHLLRTAGFAAERAFLPDDDRSPLVTYETRSPLSRFPVIGVSLAYELELAGLVRALERAGIPPLRRDRTPGHPRILLGGPLTFSNPLPAAPSMVHASLGSCSKRGRKRQVLRLERKMRHSVTLFG